jgi:hypothetical protein
MRAAAENDSLISMRDLDITDGITEIETRAHFELQVTIGYGATADGMANRDRGLRTAGCLLFRRWRRGHPVCPRRGRPE